MIFGGCTLWDIVRDYHDIEIYTQQKYLDKEVFESKACSTGYNANYFLPKYEEIEYNYSDIDFYLFDGTATMARTAVTLVLDLQFSDKAEYESAKQNELTMRNFRTEYEDKKWYDRPVFEFNIRDFFCKTVYGEDYPCRFGLICLNDSNYILRYLYFQEWESPEFVKDADYIYRCTNCPWEN